MFECVEKNIEWWVLDIVFYDLDNYVFFKMSDYLYWLVGYGCICKCNIKIVIYVFGIFFSIL